MPTYSYACTECDNRFDAVQAFTEDALTTCPECSGRLRKLSAPWAWCSRAAVSTETTAATRPRAPSTAPAAAASRPRLPRSRPRSPRRSLRTIEVDGEVVELGLRLGQVGLPVPARRASRLSGRRLQVAVIHRSLPPPAADELCCLTWSHGGITQSVDDVADRPWVRPDWTRTVMVPARGGQRTGRTCCRGRIAPRSV